MSRARHPKVFSLPLTAAVLAAWAGWSLPSLPAAAEEAETWPGVYMPGAPEVAIAPAGKDLIPVARIPPGLELDDPYGAHWWLAPYVDVQLLPQQVAMPTLEESTIDTVRVQAVTDGKDIAWRLSWRDGVPDGNVDVTRFSDAVAIELPVGEDPLPMMGHQGAKVQILYWKALWQKDIDVGFQDVQDVYPNFWSDLYWFAEGEFPYPIPDSFSNPVSRQWFVAQQAGNPMSVFSRAEPVEELVAEGWGTLTHQPHALARGRGVWVRETWAVVFVRPLETDDPLDHQFVPGRRGQVAFAVWDGAKGNVGARKHWSDWVGYEIER
jgi:hypothetical protein